MTCWTVQRWGAAALGVLLAGCASGNSSFLSLPGAVTRQLLAAPQDTVPRNPDLRFRYLRIETAGRAPAMMALGYVDPDPAGEVEVWYASNSEVLRLQNGRIVGTAGVDVDWRAVRFEPVPPAWTALSSERTTRFSRTRDESPGHRYGLSDKLELSAWTGPAPVALPTVVPTEVARQWRWFREARVDARGNALAPNWYAWGRHRGQDTVVYSEQCLSETFCLKLLRWPVLE